MFYILILWPFVRINNCRRLLVYIHEPHWGRGQHLPQTNLVTRLICFLVSHVCYIMCLCYLPDGTLRWCLLGSCEIVFNSTPYIRWVPARFCLVILHILFCVHENYVKSL
jgi:hypothetical protein